MKLRLAFLLLLGIAVFGNCNARRSSIGSYRTPAVCDSVVRQTLGDSIGSILLKPGTIRAFELHSVPDSITIEKRVKLVRNMKDLAKFSLINPEDYKILKFSVYGKFLPQFQLEVKSGKATVYCQYDFGLGIWQILNEKSEVLNTLKIGSNDCLRLAVRVFPNDDFLKELLPEEEAGVETSSCCGSEAHQ